MYLCLSSPANARPLSRCRSRAQLRASSQCPCLQAVRKGTLACLLGTVVAAAKSASALRHARGRRTCTRLLIDSVHAPFFWLLGFCLWPTFRPVAPLLAGKGFKDITTVLLCLHFSTYEYGTRHVLTRTGRRRPAIVSVLCAIGTLTLQLPSHATALQLEVLGLLLLVVFPEASILTKVTSRRDVYLAVALIAGATLLVLRSSPLLCSLLVTVFAFVSLYCPWWLIRLQNYKQTINGPWDEAKPKLIKQQLRSPPGLSSPDKEKAT